MIDFIKAKEKIPTAEKMQEIYKMLRTPNKYGAVLKFDDSLCDSPTVFKKDNIWYMLFVRIAKNTTVSGYETHIARSKDLLHWEYLYPILKRSDSNGWDSLQVGGYASFQNIEFGGNNELEKPNGNYYIVYLGGRLNGYETDPLSTGLCRVGDITNPNTVHKLPKPILTPLDKDCRPGETRTLYKHCMFIDKELMTGHLYVSAYNAKDKTNHESIFLAVSDDAENWERYGNAAVLDNIDFKISGDPQIIKISDVYVMIYFVPHGITYNTFAVSYDLIHWRNWEGEHLIQSEFEWENVNAHKSWVIKEKNKVYHFYCAVNDKGERFIALAFS